MKRKWILFLLAAAVLLSGTAMALAAQENELTPECAHHYQIVSFDRDGNIVLKCQKCRDVMSTTFVEHLNERDYEPLDVVPDGIVNAKDYGYILRHYHESTGEDTSDPDLYGGDEYDFGD
ncbi:MAG: hypothetical protein IJ168_08700 [Eubacterium sp.]|nr:hypothetical protein [Eubacterium sp.]